VGDPELAAQEDRGEVDLLHPPPGLEAGVEDGVVVRWADPGVVAADVDAAVVAGDRLVQGLDRGSGGHVGAHEHALDRLGQLAALALVDVDHGHLGPLGGEAFAHGPPDAAGPTGDHGHLVHQAVRVRRGLAHGSPYSELMKTFFTSLKESSASGPSSRPMPDCLAPPNGVQ
jgi:hypothetical protein